MAATHLQETRDLSFHEPQNAWWLAFANRRRFRTNNERLTVDTITSGSLCACLSVRVCVCVWNVNQLIGNFGQ